MNYYKNMYVDLTNCCLVNKDAFDIAKTIASGTALEGFHINLTNNAIRHEGAIALAKSIISRNVPSGLTIDLSHNDIGDEGAEAFAQALCSGQAPDHLTLFLNNNQIGTQGMNYFSQAFASGKVPSNLTIDLGNNVMNNESIIELTKTLCLTTCPQYLSIYCRSEQIVQSEHHMSRALQNNPTLLCIGFGCQMDTNMTRNILLNVKIDRCLKTNRWTIEKENLMMRLPKTNVQSYANSQFSLFLNNKENKIAYEYLENAFEYGSTHALVHMASIALEKRTIIKQLLNKMSNIYLSYWEYTQLIENNRPLLKELYIQYCKTYVHYEV